MFETGEFTHSFAFNVNIKNQSNYCDTIILPKIYKCQDSKYNSEFVGYCTCGIRCNGELIDYYINGEKRIEGTFKNGKPIGKLYYYNMDGSIKRIEKYNRKGKLRKTSIYKDISL